MLPLSYRSNKPHIKQQLRYYSLQESRSMFALIVVSKLNVTLNASKLTSLVLCDRVCAIEYCVTSLHVQQVQLHRVS